ncbi:MAG: hypothetical protein AAGD38_13355 [Acidobacteriota bacterium]
MLGTGAVPAVDPTSLSAGGTFPDPAPPPPRRAPVGRWLITGAVTLVLTAALAVGGWFFFRPGAEVPEFRGTTLEEEIQVESSKLYREGLAALEEGDFDTAREKLQEAHDMVPDSRRIKRALDQAVSGVIAPEGETSPAAEVARRLAAAREALDDRDYDDAIALAREVLSLDRRNRDARGLIQQAEDGKRRRAYVTGRTSGRPTTSAGTTTDPSTTPPPPTLGTRPGTLVIDFYSQISDGTVTIFSGTEQIFRREFAFTERTGPFTRKTDGRIDASREIGAGVLDLKVYVVPQLNGRSGRTLIQEVPGEMLAGGSQTLKIVLTGEGQLQASLQ